MPVHEPTNQLRFHRPPKRSRRYGRGVACALALFAGVCGGAGSSGQSPEASPLFGPPSGRFVAGTYSKPSTAPAVRVAVAPIVAEQAPPLNGAGAPAVGAPEVCAPEVCAPMMGPAFGPPADPGFLRSLGRYGPPPPVATGISSSHATQWDQAQVGAGAPPHAAPCYAPPNECRNCEIPFAAGDFAPDPFLDGYLWDGYADMDVYGCKHLNRTQRPWVECFTPLYGSGPWPPSYECLGPTNLVRPKFYVYGDFRTAVAANNNAGNSRTVWGNRLNLDFDLSITATERFHAFWGPLDEGQQFSGAVVDGGELEVEDHFDGFDENTDAMYFEGDLGYIVGGLAGVDAPFDLPIAVGLMPLVLQNGVWLEDTFVGAAATIPAKNSPWLDWSNFDTTVFVGFEELTTRAFGADADEANFVGATTFIERRGGYIELGWAYLDDPADLGRSYHNLGLSYTRRYLNLVSNSARILVNTGQEGVQSGRTADGVLLLLENSLLTPLPYNVVPYFNLFAGFDRPQPLGRLQGPLKNTGINFESDLLTGYPLLDDSGNNTYGGAFGVDLLGHDFDRQLIIETAVLQAFDDPVGRIAPGDQYALGLRYQRRLNNSLILRMDAMHGWLEKADDIDGARVELRHKF